jgi:hypothetical protein
LVVPSVTRSSIALLLVLATVDSAACSRDESSDRGWTTTRGEAISSVRGLPVRVRSCRGIGPATGRRYARLACAAGARLTGEDFDTVAVTFEVVPRRDEGYELENVRFFGGPGIP